MPFLRKLLSPNENNGIEDDEIILNCVNGYFIENNTICICYPGWTSEFSSLDQCTINSGENSTGTKGGIIQYNNDSVDKGFSVITIIFVIFVVLLILCFFFFIIMCLFKKYKDIKLVKEKIKNEKKKKNIYDNNIEDKHKNEKDINHIDIRKENQNNAIYVCELSQNDLSSSKD